MQTSVKRGTHGCLLYTGIRAISFGVLLVMSHLTRPVEIMHKIYDWGISQSYIRASRREGCITILSSVMPEEGEKRSTYRRERERGVCNSPNLHEPTILRWQDRAKCDFIKLFAPKSSGRTLILFIGLFIGC